MGKITWHMHLFFIWYNDWILSIFLRLKKTTENEKKKTLLTTEESDELLKRMC